jgi:hypothetical protein
MRRLVDFLAQWERRFGDSSVPVYVLWITLYLGLYVCACVYVHFLLVSDSNLWRRLRWDEARFQRCNLNLNWRGRRNKLRSQMVGLPFAMVLPVRRIPDSHVPSLRRLMVWQSAQAQRYSREYPLAQERQRWILWKQQLLPSWKYNYSQLSI